MLALVRFGDPSYDGYGQYFSQLMSFEDIHDMKELYVFEREMSRDFQLNTNYEQILMNIDDVNMLEKFNCSPLKIKELAEEVSREEDYDFKTWDDVRSYIKEFGDYDGISIGMDLVIEYFIEVAAFKGHKVVTINLPLFDNCSGYGNFY